MSVAEPKTPKQLRGFVGMVNYYKSLWPRRSATMAPLTELTGKGVPFKWTTDHSKAFKEVKNMIAQDAMLVHPNFNKPFVVQTDASKEQIGGVVSQDDKPIGFFSRKLSKAQLKYTVMEKELLGIVETLKYLEIFCSEIKSLFILIIRTSLMIHPILIVIGFYVSVC